MSLLTVVRNVCQAIGKTPPTVVANSNDATILELFVLSSKSGQELVRGYDFPEMLSNAEFLALSAEYQGDIIGLSASAVVANCDYERMVPDTFWDRTIIRKVLGPMTPAEWSQLKANNVIPNPLRFIVIGKGLYIGPNTGPAAGDTLAFMYFSNKWCQSAAGVRQKTWVADTDLGVIPEQILELDLIWRWKQAKSLAYAEDLETAQRAINAYTGSAPGRRLLILGGSGPWFPFGANIPEGNWH